MRDLHFEGLELIKRYEGYSPIPYVCPGGYTTIGWGHLVKAGEDFSDGITKEWAEELLRGDLHVAGKGVQRLIHVPLTDTQYASLVSFTFNLGTGALQRSTLRRKINRGEHEAVPHELMRWVWAGGRKLKGLVKRREAEGALYCA